MLPRAYKVSKLSILLLFTVNLSACSQSDVDMSGEAGLASSEAGTVPDANASREPMTEGDFAFPPNIISDEEAGAAIDACMGDWVSTNEENSKLYNLSVSSRQYSLMINGRLITSGTWFASGNESVSLTLSVEDGGSGESYILLDCSNSLATLIKPDGLELELQKSVN